ncbi:MAG: hypothetical protein ACE5HE_11110, partial [Phycisphaerae bacterium]
MSAPLLRSFECIQDALTAQWLAISMDGRCERQLSIVGSRDTRANEFAFATGLLARVTGECAASCEPACSGDTY